MPKRPRDASSEQASNATLHSSNDDAAVNPRRNAKKARTQELPIHETSAASEQPNDTSASSASLSLPIPKKRKVIPGTLRRLALPRPVSTATRKSGSTREDVNRRGNKINKGQGTGGFQSAADKEDVGEAVRADEGKEESFKVPHGAELWINRKTSYPAYLRSGIAAFVEKGWVEYPLSSPHLSRWFTGIILLSCGLWELPFPSV